MRAKNSHTVFVGNKLEKKPENQVEGNEKSEGKRQAKSNIADETTGNIIADKVLIIYNNTSTMLISNFLGCLPLSIMLWGDVYATRILVWVAAIYGFTLIRWLHFRSFKKTKDIGTQEEKTKKILSLGNEYTLMVFISGSIWGSAGVIFFSPTDAQAFTILILTLISIVGGSMASLSSRPLTYIAFLIPAMAPITLVMFFQHSTFYHLLTFGFLIFLSATLFFSRNFHNVIHQSLILKYKNIELFADLKKQTSAANKANNEKSHFIAAASHDLRQPLHAVNLFAESLGNKITNEEQRHDLNRIHRGLDSLGELFNALLDISQLDAGAKSVNKINFPISQQLQKLTDQHAVDAQAKGIRLTFNTCNHVVYSDPALLEQIIGNLLSNAIRYTEQGSVDIFCTINADNRVQIHIKDSGVGISTKDADNIFNEFVQLDNPERDRKKGLGLGLSIVKRTSALLDHKISFHSVLGEGTEFIVELPLGQSINQAVHIQLSVPTKNLFNGMLVMVIDNETDILDGMKSLLEAWGSNVTCADSSGEALEMLKNGYQPQFILADYRMPGELNGCNIIRLIREKTGSIPALIISGDVGAQVIAEIKEEELMVLSKPIKPAQLRVAMTRLVGAKEK